jgi:acyl carrier protein
MMHFQQTMLQMTQHFLSTQQEVMLCYLQEVSRSQAATTPPQVNSRQLLHLAEPTGVPKRQNVILDEPSKASDHRQQNSIDDRVGMLSASENFVMPSRAESGIPIDEVTPELSNEGLIAALMDLISERTGYPIDMIGPSLDLESDLGIDSIKRIEILNKFQSVLPSQRRALLENSLEELTSARTVNQIIEWIIKPRD